MFFDDWFGLVRILIVGILAYAALIFLLLASGKRTLSKWNAFDFVVTIALGSTFATVIISKDVSFAEGILALGLLVGLQFVITWLSVRFNWAEKLVKAQPTLLFDKGVFLTEAMKRQRVAEGEVRMAIRAKGVAEGEVRMAIRAKGIAAVEEVEAFVLETDGSFSVIKKSKTGSRSALADIS
ncbi:MAG TPA: YetF domain-containing protein [Pyrinomonadaceae bacterium]|nr:YetF domain-containing protein [Pyrinomonadaceae bacterium]